MPLSVLQPRPVARITYALIVAAGLAFAATQDSVSVRLTLGEWAPVVTGTMLIIGGVIATFGSWTRRYSIEAAGFPFMVGVWLVYAIAVGVRHFNGDVIGTGGPPPLGFAFLLGAGSTALLGRGIEMVKAHRIDRELRARQARRQK